MSIKKRSSRSACLVQPLEDRTLFSSWGTIDNFQLATGKNALTRAMTTDAQGNVYAAGQATDSSGALHGLVREQAVGSTDWTTVADFSYPGGGGTFLNGLAFSPSGDLYVSGGSNSGRFLILERPAGQTAFSVVDDFNAPGGYADGVAVDESGNVFAVGSTFAPSGKSSTDVWITREQPAGQGSFRTVDTYQTTGGDDGTAVTAIPSGPAAGVYTVGMASDSSNNHHWVVRKSVNGGSSWAIVDDFLYGGSKNSAANADPYAIAADLAGNLYVVGQGTAVSGRTSYHHWLVRKSTNGGGSWTLDDDFQLQSSSTLAQYAEAVGTDPTTGTVYVAGIASDSTPHAVVRSNAAGRWSTVDSFQLSAGAASGYYAFAAGPDGSLYAGGYGNDSAGEHWVARSQPALTAAIATPTLGAGEACSTTISFNRTVSGFGLSDLTLTTPTGTFSGSDLIADGATLTTSDNINYVLTLPTSLTSDSGGYQLLLTAAGSGIADGNDLPLESNAMVSWIE